MATMCVFQMERGLTVVPQEGDVEIITDGYQPQGVSHKVAEEPVRFNHYHMFPHLHEAERNDNKREHKIKGHSP